METTLLRTSPSVHPSNDAAAKLRFYTLASFRLQSYEQAISNTYIPVLHNN